MTNNNEIMNINTHTGEIMESQSTSYFNAEQVIQETEDYIIVKQSDGKYRKDMKYKEYFSNKPESREEMIELYKVLNSADDDTVKPMSTLVGKEVTIKEVYISPYEAFDEKTGNNLRGVTTTIETDIGYIATSSKSVYYSLINLFKVFGYPHEEKYEPIKVRITGTRMNNGVQINISLV